MLGGHGSHEREGPMRSIGSAQRFCLRDAGIVPFREDETKKFSGWWSERRGDGHFVPAWITGGFNGQYPGSW